LNKAKINEALEQRGKELLSHEHLLQQEQNTDSLAWRDRITALVFIPLLRKCLHQLISAKGLFPTRR
jgi:hypothetical protein